MSILAPYSPEEVEELGRRFAAGLASGPLVANLRTAISGAMTDGSRALTSDVAHTVVPAIEAAATRIVTHGGEQAQAALSGGLASGTEAALQSAQAELAKTRRWLTGGVVALGVLGVVGVAVATRGQGDAKVTRARSYATTTRDAQGHRVTRTATVARTRRVR